MDTLLSVDVGLRTGLALYGGNGRLHWYRSRNFGRTAALKRAVFALLRDPEGPTHLVLEGGGPLAEVWLREAQRRHLEILQIAAETWRNSLLLPREQRTGRQAKAGAGDLARRVIAWSGAPRPTALRHDAAEAILAGLWGVLQLGWLATLPGELRS